MRRRSKLMLESLDDRVLPSIFVALPAAAPAQIGTISVAYQEAPTVSPPPKPIGGGH